MIAAMACVLHLAPHPDDEAIPAIATLLALRRAEHTVVNVACSLGRADQRDRRLAELEEACRRADFELVAEHARAMSGDDDLRAAEDDLVKIVLALVEDLRVDLIVSPSPHDGHHAHEAVGRVARDVAEATGVRWWMWALWGELPFPTLYSAFDDALLEPAIEVLRAHEGELERNDYTLYVRGRAVADRVVGAERVFGFGARMRPEPYAELLTEVGFRGGAFTAGDPRVLDPDDPLPALTGGRPIGWWLDADSVSDRARAEGLDVSSRPSPSSPSPQRS
jgi:LmbE family N-acetylglucosaminyl deacetylase